MRTYIVYLPIRGLVGFTIESDSEFNALKKAINYVADNGIYDDLMEEKPDYLELDVGQTDFKPACRTYDDWDYSYEYTDEEIKAVGLIYGDGDDGGNNRGDDAVMNYQSGLNYYGLGALVSTYSEAKKAGLPQEILDKISNLISSLLNGSFVH
jgi:hypothetical protein